MSERIKGVPVKDVEADEMWGFEAMRNTRLSKAITDLHEKR